MRSVYSARVPRPVSKKARPRRIRADFLLVTALDEEREALLSALPVTARKLRPGRKDIHYYYAATLAVSRDERYGVVVMSVSAMGRVRAAVATAHALERWRPRAVILAGIGGGIAAQGVRLGDVLIADLVVDYELQKLKKPAQAPRFVAHPADARLIEAAHHLDRGWAPAERPVPGTPVVFFGPVATGDKVVAVQAFLTALLKHWPRAIGVEMEAGGVATACYQAAVTPHFLMVRGVSDLADEAKGTAEVEQWRCYARDVAAGYSVALIRSGALPARPRRRRSPSAAPAGSEAPSGPAPSPSAGNRMSVGQPFRGMTYLIGRGGSKASPIVPLHLSNSRDGPTYDDVVVELRLPFGVCYIASKDVGLGRRSHLGQVTIGLTRPVHPGASIELGHAARHTECDPASAVPIGHSRAPDVLDWTITARNVPPRTGSVDLSSLKDSGLD